VSKELHDIAQDPVELRVFINCILPFAATAKGLVAFLIYIHRTLLPEAWLGC
jgi:hypothetical protein